MTEDELKDLYDRAYNIFGQQMQEDMCIEEMSELTKEIVKHRRGFENMDHVAEEIADVIITVEQLVKFYHIKNDVKKWKAKKLERLKNTIEAIEKERK